MNQKKKYNGTKIKKKKTQQRIKKQFNKNGITKLVIIEDNLIKGKATN